MLLFKYEHCLSIIRLAPAIAAVVCRDQILWFIEIQLVVWMFM